jgi:hypothetical protein
VSDYRKSSTGIYRDKAESTSILKPQPILALRSDADKMFLWGGGSGFSLSRAKQTTVPSPPLQPSAAVPANASTSAGTVCRQVKGQLLLLLEMASALVVEGSHNTTASTPAAVSKTAITMQAARAHALRDEGSAAGGLGCRAADARGRQGATLGMTGPGAEEKEKLISSAAEAAGHSDSQSDRGGVVGATGAADTLKGYPGYGSPDPLRNCRF